MKVVELMTKHPQYLSPEDTVVEAAKLMKKLDCGIVPVGDGKRLLGMVSDRDIAVRVVAKGKNPSDVKLKNIMSPEVWYCKQGDDVKTAAHSMENKRVKRLVVLDNNKKFTGIISLGDIGNAAANQSLCGEIVEKVFATQ